jgi:hypothetical protein
MDRDRCAYQGVVIEMAAFEEFVHVEHSSALSFEQLAGKLCRVHAVRTRAAAVTHRENAAALFAEDGAVDRRK